MEMIKGNILRKEVGEELKKIGEPHGGSPKYITNTPKYSHKLKIISFLITYLYYYHVPLEGTLKSMFLKYYHVNFKIY